MLGLFAKDQLRCLNNKGQVYLTLKVEFVHSSQEYDEYVDPGYPKLVLADGVHTQGRWEHMRKPDQGESVPSSAGPVE